MFQATTAQRKISKLRKRIRIVQGGTSSSKTFSIIPLLIQYAIQKPNSEISIVSESIPHLKRGAIRDFKKIMIWTQNWIEQNFNKSSHTYNFTNGSFIEFFSADQPDKLRGARRDVLFINECNKIDFESYQQLAIRTKKFIYLDYNPSSEFWVHENLVNDKDSDFIILTYKDNEALEESIVKELEKARDRAHTSTYWDNWWKVYGLGQVGQLEGAVFTDWEIGNFNPDNLQTSFGQDFGFSNDPTTLVEVAIDKKKKIIYLKEHLYKIKLTTSQIAEINLKHAGRKLIVADSAEPRLISELNQKGCNVVASIKGKDSIRAGVSIMQDFKIIIDPNSHNAIREFKYHIYVDKVSQMYIDDFNHIIDPARYNVSYHLSGDYTIILA